MTASASVVEAAARRILDLMFFGGVSDKEAAAHQKQNTEQWQRSKAYADAALNTPHSAEQDAREAVAWRVKDYADGWILFHHEAPARKSAEARNGALVRPLYTHPAPVLTAGGAEVVTVRSADVWRLILAADQYGVRFLDSDDMSDEARELQAATEALKDLVPYSRATPVQPDRGGVVEALREKVALIIRQSGIDRGWAKPGDAEVLTDRILAALAPVAAEGGEKDRLRIVYERWTQENAEGVEVIEAVGAFLSALRTEPTGGGEGA